MNQPEIQQNVTTSKIMLLIPYTLVSKWSKKQLKGSKIVRTLNLLAITGHSVAVNIEHHMMMHMHAGSTDFKKWLVRKKSLDKEWVGYKIQNCKRSEKTKRVQWKYKIYCEANRDGRRENYSWILQSTFFYMCYHKKDIAVYKRKIDALSIESQHPMQLIHYKYIYAISIILRQSIVC